MFIHLRLQQSPITHGMQPISIQCERFGGVHHDTEGVIVGPRLHSTPTASSNKTRSLQLLYAAACNGAGNASNPSLVAAQERASSAKRETPTTCDNGEAKGERASSNSDTAVRRLPARTLRQRERSENPNVGTGWKGTAPKCFLTLRK